MSETTARRVYLDNGGNLPSTLIPLLKATEEQLMKLPRMVFDNRGNLIRVVTPKSRERYFSRKDEEFQRMRYQWY